MVQLHVVTCEQVRRSSARDTILWDIVLTLLGLGLACGITACAPKLVGPTNASGYFFSLQGSDLPLDLRPTGAETEVIVRVQDARGQPVDGVPVIFEVEPGWAQHASVSPSQVTTRGGMARTVFTARLTGIVHVTARVDHTTAQAQIIVQSPKPSRDEQLRYGAPAIPRNLLTCCN